MTIKDNKIIALAQVLKVEPEVIKRMDDEYSQYETPDGNYNVFTMFERNREAEENIYKNLWKFDAGTILDYCDVAENWSLLELEKAKNALRETKEYLKDKATPLIACLITNMDDFTDAVLSITGFGHYLSPYDGKEIKSHVSNEEFYIYKQSDNKRKPVKSKEHCKYFIICAEEKDKNLEDKKTYFSPGGYWTKDFTRASKFPRISEKLLEHLKKTHP